MRVLVTGGAGFIGSALIRHLMACGGYEVMNLDALTYAGAPGTLATVAGDPRYHFVHGDVRDAATVRGALGDFRPDVVAHLAAESHVDRSIRAPGPFVETNLIGTYVLLEEALAFWRALDSSGRARFRLHHISTDEVFGSLGEAGRFAEESRYDPRSPYAASKAGADHLVRAWGHTYGLPVLLTNCSNNYGPYQYPEKLIPRMIVNALRGEVLPLFGRGEQVRDWLFVEDHVRALTRVFEAGQTGRSYMVGGDAERRNIDLVEAICAILDRERPRADGLSYRTQIGFVADRPGHDFRYAVDAGRIRTELGWAPSTPLEEGLAQTVRWYLQNEGWWGPLVSA